MAKWFAQRQQEGNLPNLLFSVKEPSSIEKASLFIKIPYFHLSSLIILRRPINKIPKLKGQITPSIIPDRTRRIRSCLIIIFSTF